MLHGLPLAPTTSQVDLGIIIKDDLKWDLQTTSVVKKANSLLYRIRKAFVEIDAHLLRQILVTYVLPLIEFGATIWSPYLSKDIEALERTLKRASKIPRELRSLPYEDRLRALQLDSLAERRSQQDLTETFRILKGFYNVPGIDEIFLRANTHHLRGHPLKLNLGRISKQYRKHYLTNRVVRAWNALPAACIASDTIASFKASVLRHLHGAT